MSFIGAAILGSAAIGAGASIFGATTQASAEQQAQQQLIQQQQQAQKTTQKLLAPYTQFGQSNIPTLQSLLQPGPNQNATLSQLPGFQFAQNWGLKGVQNVQSTRGLGGNALAAGAKFGTGLAQQNWGDYVNKLLAGTQIGASAANTGVQATTGLAQSFAPNIAQTQIGQGNALAGGAMGVSNALGTGVNNALLAQFAGMYGGQGNQPYGNTGYNQQQAFDLISGAR